MHANKKNNYRIRDDYITERWYQHVQQGITMINIQQQGKINNHVVFDCLDGYAVCINDK